jgi:serine/threonine protein kinase
VGSELLSVRAVFDQAVEKPPEDRRAFLEEVGVRAPEVRRAVEALLKEHEDAGGILDRCPVFSGETVDLQPAAPPAGPGANAAWSDDLTPGAEVEEIGRSYRLVALLGEGGMGSVWQAEQERPIRRTVALKVIRSGLQSEQFLARFESERATLERMDHPHVARLLDAGTAQTGVGHGRPFLVMELVPGVPITEFCDTYRLDIRRRVELFVAVCQGVQHAHQKGVIHRDLSPSNVLVALVGGCPVPKVIDFGVAKAIGPAVTEQTFQTDARQIIGKLEYMSPEQARLNNLDVDTRTDIYALGVMLYELLTGATPLGRERLRAAPLQDLLRCIGEVDPPRPSTRLKAAEGLPALAVARGLDPRQLIGVVRGDLDQVVMKCLEKDRDRRYESADALARDLQHHLDDEPVSARPPTSPYRLQKFLRKHRAAVWTAAALAGLLVLGTAVSTWQMVRAQRAMVRAIQAEQKREGECDRAQRALVSQVVERLEGEVRQFEVLGRAMQADLEARDCWTKTELKGWLVTLLDGEERLRSVSVAFEPRRLEGREDYCLYVSRGPRGIEVTELLPMPGQKFLARRGPRGVEYLDPIPVKAYLPNYREWDWYRKPFRARKPLWLGPGADLGDWTVSCCVPFRYQGEWAGVLTIDLSVDYFRRVWDWLDEARLGQKSYGFVIAGADTWDGNAPGNDRTGTFIGHPDHRPPRTIQEVAAQAKDPAFDDLTRRLLSESQDSRTAIDPRTGRRSTFVFGRVPSAGWTFVAVIEQ